MSQRLDRINELLRREISTVVQRDFEFEHSLVTINAVEISPDLRAAKVHIGVLGGSSRKVLETLNNKHGLVQSRIAKRIILRRLPVLSFYTDKSSEQGVSMVQLLDEIEKLPKAPPAEQSDDLSS